MRIELHMIQNFAPSNLNRDDTNAPKEAEFGGYRRARISSQCLKRAIRMAFREGAVPEEHLAIRTKKVQDEVVDRLTVMGRPADEAAKVAFVLLDEIFGMKENQEKEPSKTDASDALVFLGKDELDGITAVCDKHWNTLLALTNEAQVSKKAKGKKDKKSDAKLPKDIADEVKEALDGHRAIDLALFGRMIAKRPEHNVDAACQVAHAISTHVVNTEFDYFTAVDDKADPSESGSAMLGMKQFNAPCVYRYSSVDLRQLAENLQGDTELVRLATEAYLRTAIMVIPTANQSTMPTPTPPSFVMIVVRENGIWSLVNAFAKPVRPTEDEGLVERSILALDDYWGRLVRMYGGQGIRQIGATMIEDVPLKNLRGFQLESVDELVRQTMCAAFGDK